MGKWVKIILIIFSLIGCIIMSGLLLSKIGDVRRLNGAATKATTYSCDSGWNLSGTKCTKTSPVKNSCPSGYAWSSTKKVCYKKANGLIWKSCSSGDKKDIINNTTVCTRSKSKNCDSYKASGVTITKKGDKCILTKNATKASNTITLTFCFASTNDSGKEVCRGTTEKVTILKGSKYTFPTTLRGKKYSRYDEMNSNNRYYAGKTYEINKSATYTMVTSGNFSDEGWGYDKDYYYGLKMDKNMKKEYKKNAWQDNCYLGSNGYVQRGLQRIGDNWYYLIVTTGSNSKPNCTSYKYTWHCDKKKGAYWYGYSSTYFIRNGVYPVGSHLYSFDSKGYCTGSNCHNEKCK